MCGHRQAKRLTERETDERSLIIGALDSEFDTWTTQFHILNTKPTFVTTFALHSSLLGPVR